LSKTKSVSDPLVNMRGPFVNLLLIRSAPHVNCKPTGKLITN